MVWTGATPERARSTTTARRGRPSDRVGGRKAGDASPPSTGASPSTAARVLDDALRVVVGRNARARQLLLAAADQATGRRTGMLRDAARRPQERHHPPRLAFSTTLFASSKSETVLVTVVGGREPAGSKPAVHRSVTRSPDSRPETLGRRILIVHALGNINDQRR